ncbi:MAG: hypothetical protein JO053_15485 [Acidobacteria bacterium]|nr:hypothetical protein [Acidobacteriota bacterium]
MKKWPFLAVFFLVGIGLSCSSGPLPGPDHGGNANTLSEKGDKDKKKKTGQEPDNANAATANSLRGACNASLWDRVYERERLEVKDECMTVTGTIAERNADDDGDEHMLLRLDDGQANLLTKKNEKKKDGALVIEAVCVNATKLKKVGDTCAGFTNPVALPQVGDHVRVTGSYVIDSHNGWAEIHPISKVEKME